MSLTTEPTLRVVLYEGADAQPLEDGERFAACSALLEKGFALTRTVAGGRVAPHDRAALLVLGKFVPDRNPWAGVDTASVHFRDIVGLEATAIAEQAETIR